MAADSVDTKVLQLVALKVEKMEKNWVESWVLKTVVMMVAHWAVWMADHLVYWTVEKSVDGKVVM
jgi:hypothetical protein